MLRFGRPRRQTVRLLVLVILAGAAVLSAYLRPHAPPAYVYAPPTAQLGVPDRPVRFVSYNILHNQRGKDAILAEIQRLEPDFVLLQEVESRDVDEMARRLGMRSAYEGRVYYPSENLAGRRASWGNAILSKHPLYEAESIPNPGGGSFGVWAAAVVDGKKFYVASVHLSATWKVSVSHANEQANRRHGELRNLVNAWGADRKPPIVVGGDFNQLPMGNNYYEMTRHWTDALGALGKTDNTFKSGLLVRTRIDYLLSSREWQPQEGGVVNTDASDHRPIWVTLEKAP
jgi:endonuclease/exonuclease/phosphatase family metal-dependent hydrolase